MHANLKAMLVGLALWALVPVASAFPLTAQLTGDGRPNIPDDLVINVTITLVDADTVQWTIDIDSPTHVNAKLDEFYFNILTPVGGSFSFDGFSPVDWAVASPATTAGGGSIAFNFEALDPSGPPNAADVTNTVDLVFNMNLLGGGTFTEAMFLTAGTSCSSDVALGCGQLGAHLQALSPVPPNTLDSGFLLGTYVEPSPRPIPEPGTLSLLGAMLLSLGLMRLGRRRT